jgi:cytochrome c553
MNMKRKLSAVALFLIIGTPAFADGLVGGSADAGKDKAVSCGACHGADGNSANPAWPSLAGQHAPYILAQLKAFKSSKRTNPLMMGQVAALSDQDMADLAAYFSEQTAAPRTVADASLVDKGEALYRGGNKANGTPACMACHGPDGSGNPAAAYPVLSGQHATYTAAQLRLYASGERKSDSGTKVMRDIARSLQDCQDGGGCEIEAIASYIQGLR